MTIRKIPPRSDRSLAPGGMYNEPNAQRGKWEDMSAKTAQAIGRFLPNPARLHRRNRLTPPAPCKSPVYLGERKSEPDFRQYFKANK